MKNYFNINILILLLSVAVSMITSTVTMANIALPELSQEMRNLANETNQSNARLNAFAVTKPVISQSTHKHVKSLVKWANQNKQQQHTTVSTLVDTTINNSTWQFKQAQQIKSLSNDFNMSNQQSNNSQQNDNNQHSQAVSGHRLYLFVSSSIPKAKMRAYARQLQKYKNAQMIMRGFMGGGKKMQPTMSYIKSIITKADHCNGVHCPTYKIQFNIDPVLFQRYNITKVPTLVYVDNLSGAGYCSEGNGDIVSAKGVHRFVGLAPLKYMISELAQTTQLPKLRQLATEKQ